MNFCQSCGTKLEQADVFCPNCGQKLLVNHQGQSVKQPQSSYNSDNKKPTITSTQVLRISLLFGAIISHFAIIILVFQKWINVEAYRALKETAQVLKIRTSLEYQYSLFDISDLAQTFFSKAQKYDYVDYQDIKSLELISTVLIAVSIAIIVINLLAVTMIFIKQKHAVITTILSCCFTALIGVAFYIVVSYVNSYIMELSELDFDRALSATLTPLFIIMLSVVAMVLKFLAYRKNETNNVS